jgi:queuine tRNA-ribosyltransferase
MSGEILGSQIASLHNLHFYLWLMKEARTRILNGTFAGWKTSVAGQVSRRL